MILAPILEDLSMNLPAILQGESRTRLFQGIALGAVATLAIGFGFGGWMLGSSARTMAAETATKAVVAAIAPICVDQFQRSADAASNMEELKKVSSWKQATFVEEGGWAKMPGSDKADSGVAKACAKMLSEL
jgi:microcompartment protein CcmK/EutM